MIDVGFASRAVPRCIRGGDTRAPTVAPLSMDTVVAMPVVVQRQLLWSRRLKTARSRSCSTSSFDVPVVQVHLGVQSWTRSLTCPLLSTTGFLHSGCAPDSVHRGYGGHSSSQQRQVLDLPVAAMMGLVDAFCVIFRAPPASRS